MQESRYSFCRKEVMSVCTAGNDNRQKECLYYEKAYISEKCMYFVFNEYCDCLRAQINAL